MATALITGGTSGIGAEFARAYARRGLDVIIVARDTVRLAQMAEELRAIGAPSVEVLPADLSVRSQVLTVAARLEDQDRPVDILVNNAGFGLHLRLVTEDYDTIDRAIEVMVSAVFILGGAAARAMSVRKSGQIINLSSTAGFMTMGAYSAIKAWVLSYSQGLSVELKGTGVTATALCPGWVKTEFHDRAGVDPKTIPGPLWVDLSHTVETAIRASERGKAVTIPSARFSVLMFFIRHLPLRTVRWISGKISSSRRKEPAGQSSTGAGAH